ncbi:MAG TPA: hypothetical protein VFC39_05305 [Acidobacteriaceae bacterium]|nr:hypothetical protein [Acidobacteriaceae bacterium]
MAVLHISEEEAVKDFGSVLSKVDDGYEIVVDRPGPSVTIKGVGLPPARTIAEGLAILEEREKLGVLGVMDEDFANDVRKFRERHPESLDSSKWD